jgi:hypothetical protein
MFQACFIPSGVCKPLGFSQGFMTLTQCQQVFSLAYFLPVAVLNAGKIFPLVVLLKASTPHSNAHDYTDNKKDQH